MKKSTLLLSILLFSNMLLSQQKDSLSHPKLKLDLVLFDYPYQIDAAKTVNNGKFTFGSFFKGYANPSMSQSLAISSDVYSSIHYGIDRLFNVEDKYLKTKNKLLHLASISLVDFLLISIPFGDAWIHEEYHRAVLSRFHVSSFNDVNSFPFGSDVIYVKHLKDEDLVRFKAKSPQDFIRMHVAGIEGEYLLNDNLQKNNFFYNQHLTHEIEYLFSTLNAISYVQTSAKSSIDEETIKTNLKEKIIRDRDFTGFDFLGWAYDLFNPNEPYQDRGIHPTGIGIDRYRKTTDLTPEALKYLKQQGRLQWLNIASPMLFFQKSLRWNERYQFNFAIRHLLTSFGNDISLNVFLKRDNNNFIFRYHQAQNYKTVYPALEFEMFEMPLNIKNQRFLISPRIITGVQPKDQLFKTNKYAFLGFAGFRLNWISKGVDPWIEFGAKTQGWIAGNEFLNSNFSFRIGISKRFF